VINTSSDTYILYHHGVFLLRRLSKLAAYVDPQVRSHLLRHFWTPGYYEFYGFF
jgi:hypothetical protein